MIDIYCIAHSGDGFGLIAQLVKASTNVSSMIHF
jgi:hypothetical protein